MTAKSIHPLVYGPIRERRVMGVRSLAQFRVSPHGRALHRRNQKNVFLATSHSRHACSEFIKCFPSQGGDNRGLEEHVAWNCFKHFHRERMCSECSNPSENKGSWAGIGNEPQSEIIKTSNKSSGHQFSSTNYPFWRADIKYSDLPYARHQSSEIHFDRLQSNGGSRNSSAKAGNVMVPRKP